MELKRLFGSNLMMTDRFVYCLTACLGASPEHTKKVCVYLDVVRNVEGLGRGAGLRDGVEEQSGSRAVKKKAGWSGRAEG